VSRHRLTGPAGRRPARPGPADVASTRREVVDLAALAADRQAAWASSLAAEQQAELAVVRQLLEAGGGSAELRPNHGGEVDAVARLRPADHGTSHPRRQ
jgi:hypothetical protein